jgi:quinol monooxygenase YgiN
MGVGVIVDLHLKPGGVEKWKERLADMLPTARRWRGCEQIYSGCDQNNPNRLKIVQKWTSREDYDDFSAWMMAQPGSQDMLGYLDRDMQVTFIDDYGI